MKKQFILEVNETLTATYLVEADESATKEDFETGNYEILDTLDDGMGNVVQDDIKAFREAKNDEKQHPPTQVK
ncbi:MAG: hypothetical protein HRU18_01165 [Pseudoalteromonas sp.]|uniref:hypothetical protein n=1 Tax=Pseudoalteromonas sp. TaxID=53249 RepID=UPI001DDD13E1|nr:hypothetical protein [Pseudoalteromonas sp.]NRA76789.1 hypothetical protein [Pseudoalteromonas sp.]